MVLPLQLIPSLFDTFSTESSLIIHRTDASAKDLRTFFKDEVACNVLFTNCELLAEERREIIKKTSRYSQFI